jgi:hypothetical protein
MKRNGGMGSGWSGLFDSANKEQAEAAINRALTVIGQSGPVPARLGDLADAIDAFREDSFYIAKVLAEAAVREKSLSQYSQRSSGSTPSIEELRREFINIRIRKAELP